MFKGGYRHGQQLAAAALQRGARVHGLLTLLVGAVLLIAMSFTDGVGFTAILRAIGGSAVVVGLWYIASGRSFAEGDDNLPLWWKAIGIAAILAGAAGQHFLFR